MINKYHCWRASACVHHLLFLHRHVLIFFKYVQELLSTEEKSTLAYFSTQLPILCVTTQVISIIHIRRGRIKELTEKSAGEQTCN